MNQFKIDEKLELCKELGLEKLTSYFEDVRKMTGLNFNKTTEQEINDKIKEIVKKTDQYKKLSKQAWRALTPFGCSAVFVLAFSFSIKSPDLKFMEIILGLLFSLIGAVMTLLDRHPSCQLSVESKNINIWNEDIPYGALLAMKEAKENGLKKFNIYYPTFARKEDPILTGEDANGNLYELFHWDDKKIYNS